MSVQPSIASIFGKRKRLVTDDVFKSKLLKTDRSPTLTKFTRTQSPAPAEFVEPRTPDRTECSKVVRSETAEKATSLSGQAGGKGHHHRSARDKGKLQLDIRESLKKCQEKQPQSLPPPPPAESPVKFHLLGTLSPAKKSSQKNRGTGDDLGNCPAPTSVHDKEGFSVPEPVKSSTSVRNLNFGESQSSSPTEDIIQSAKEFVTKIRETQKKLTVEGSTADKAISLKGIKDKINRSSKLIELKKSINKINQHAEELIELEKRKLTGAQPKLTRFKSFDIDVPVSPKKNALFSPVKQHHQQQHHNQRSPVKPAYERFAGLVETTTSLPLPFGYQRLFEFFSAADTICSMIINRGEILTFNKLKPAVEEMTRKTFTTRHLGQIATVYPDAYRFHQEKLRNFGSTSKADRYELVITPVVQKNSGSTDQATTGSIKDDDVFRRAEKRSMTPKVLKMRKDTFHQCLLEKTKDYHEEFLKTLEPPITIDRNDLKRWHPNFMVDFVPDISPQELPQPPNSEKAATAKEVLDRARNFLSSNVRLQKALEAAAGEDEGPSIVKEQVKTATPDISAEAKAKIDAKTSSVLKGIPKSLLEKVRAKQAAKALDAMRMTPEQEKETLMYARLPEMARIIRTTFVNEQKAVLPLDILFEKVQFSCNRSLALREIESHVRLLTQLLPEWFSIVVLRNLNFAKINRGVDVASVMAKLNKLVEEKTKERAK